MAESSIKIKGKKESFFMDKVKDILPEGGNLNLCLTCGACASGCPPQDLRTWIPANSCACAPWAWMRK